MDPVSFDISEHTGLLQPGQNVLALHGLNLNANDEDFVIGATVTGSETILTERKYFSDPFSWGSKRSRRATPGWAG